MALPVYQAFNEGKTVGTSVVVTKPSGVVEGDLLIGFLSSDGGSETHTSPESGSWNIIYENQSEGSGKQTFSAWWKIAGGSEPANYTFGCGSSEGLYAWIIRVSGVHQTDPIHKKITQFGDTSSASCVQVTTEVNDCLIIYAFGADHVDITEDSGWYRGTNITVDRSGTAAGDCSGGASWFNQADLGEGLGNYCSLTGTEEYVTVTIAIQPPAGAGNEFFYTGNGQYVWSGVAGQTYSINLTYTGNGQTIWEGIAPQKYSINLSYTGDGVFTYSGSAQSILGFSFVGNGQFVYDGLALSDFSLSYIGVGQLDFSGSADQVYSVNLSYMGNGSYIFSGLGTYILGFIHIGDGQFVYSGSADYEYSSGTHFEYTSNGQYAFSGMALQEYFVNLSYLGNGVYNFSGSALCNLEFSHIGNGEFIFSGSALYSYKPDYVYIGNGSYTMDGMADYCIELTYIGNGEFIFSGDALCDYTISGAYVYIGNGVFVYSGHGSYKGGSSDKHASIITLN